MKRHYTKPENPNLRGDNTELTRWFLNTIIQENNAGIMRQDIINRGKLNSPIHIMRSLKRRFGMSFYSSTDGKKKYYIDPKFSDILGIRHPPPKSKLMKTYEKFKIGHNNIHEFINGNGTMISQPDPSISGTPIVPSKPVIEKSVVPKVKKIDKDALLFDSLFNGIDNQETFELDYVHDLHELHELDTSKHELHEIDTSKHESDIVKQDTRQETRELLHPQFIPSVPSVPVFVHTHNYITVNVQKESNVIVDATEFLHSISHHFRHQFSSI